MTDECEDPTSMGALPEWEVVYTFKTRVRARDATDALVEARPTLSSQHALQMTDIQCYHATKGDLLQSVADEQARRVARRLERSKSSPLSVLQDKAAKGCAWCWWRIPCAKDPKLGWVHIDTDEYRSRGSRAVHVCEVQGLSDEILKLEEAERKR